MAAQVLDVVADAAHAELAEIGEVLANLRGVQMKLLGQRLRRDGADAGASSSVRQRRYTDRRLVVSSETASPARAGSRVVRLLHKLRTAPSPAPLRTGKDRGGRVARTSVLRSAPWLTRARRRAAGAAPFQPYVPATQSPAEFTAKAVVLGAIFGLMFGASTVYLGLRAGLTVSASIPIAVLAISVLKRLGGSTILENNIVQTIGSAGESVAAGVVFTVPALIFLGAARPGYFNYFQITLLAFAGGILGVLMMVPLRRALIVKEHGVLPYPEGHGVRGRARGRRARRRAGQDGLPGPRLRRAVEGAVVDRPVCSAPRSDTSLRAHGVFPNATLNVDISPEYMGVGYVIGPRIAGVMFAGGVLSWMVLLPLLSIAGRS